ncbi:hydroxyacid dehydrogenase [Desertihabitans brevis]|nr:hydroxyacid dehydrogenase [Desertihabitans brevis]
MSGAAPRALAVMGRRAWEMQFDDARVARFRSLATVPAEPWVPDLDSAAAADLAATEVLLTGWGAPVLDAAALERMPRLRAVLHCAGSVRGFVTDALWERGVEVSTSADLNAEPVAEFTLAAIIMAGKKAPFLAADARTSRTDWSYRHARGRLSNSGLTIGLVGFSRVGRRVAALLRQLHDPTVLVCDPYADPDEVRAAGASLVGLAEMLPRLDVLSIHAPDLPSTRHMVGAEQLAALPDHATVINTARGALIDTAALERECVSGRLHAVLDVTDPEPLPADSPLYDLPNVMLTPHVAGSLDTEARRMTDGALQELERLTRGEPLARPVRRSELARSA